MGWRWSIRSLASVVTALLAASPGFAGPGSLPSELARLLASPRDPAAGFGIPTTFVLAPPGRAVAIGDANRDGVADVVVTRSGSDTAWVLSGDGAGGFGAPMVLPEGLRQRVEASADFDGDGVEDQAVAEPFAAGVLLRFGDGRGGFRATASEGQRRFEAALVADLDADGYADVAVVDSRASHVAVFLGDGRGGVGKASRVPVGTRPIAVATGDFDQDGVADLAVVNAGDASVSILIGDGVGGFAARRPAEVGAPPGAVATGDVSGDGQADVVVAGELNTVIILLGDGSGGLGSPTRVAVPADGDRSVHDDDAPGGVAALTLSPATIAGGSGGVATGTVTLDAPAPAGGVVVTLASSNVELAATVPSLTIPAGATQGTFSVATNDRYRKYSGLAFSVTISATHAVTRSATLSVTAAPRPPDFTSGVPPGAQTQWQGLICGRIGPIGGNPEILYSCTPPTATQFGNCTFRQECSIGCRRVRPSGVVFNDFCMTAGPGPVAVSRNHIVSGDRVPATLTARLADRTPGFIPNGLPGAISNQNQPGAINGLNANASTFPHEAIFFPLDAPSVGFDVATSFVPSTTFTDVVGEWVDDAVGFTAANGAAGHAWIAMVPPDPAPPLPVPTLGDFKITGLNPVTGGQDSFGQMDISGITSGGGPVISLTSSHPAIASVPATFTMPPSLVLGQQVFITTQPPAADTDVTITATDGHYTFSAVLRVQAPPPPPLLSALSIEPASVVGGNPAIGTVTLSRPAPSGGASVALSTTLPEVAILPAAVTVSAGATSATFAIATTVVAETFHVNVFADLEGASRQALLMVTPGGPPPPPVPAAPRLVSPAEGSRPAQPVTFDWSNVANAARYEIQIDDSSAFAAPLVLSRTVTGSRFTAGTLPARRLWWRVRAINAAGTAGPFSAVRRVEPRPRR